MSRSYRLLSEGMPPPRSAGSASFSADPRKARQWVASLPRANALSTQQSLGQALDNLASQRLDGAQRLGVLEELRPAVGESIGLLKSEYLSSPLPLDSARTAPPTGNRSMSSNCPRTIGDRTPRMAAICRGGEA